jgi:transposase
MGRRVARLALAEGDRAVLEGAVRSPTSAQRDVLRARILLLRSEGKKEEEVAAILAASRPTVSLWVKRYRSQGLAGLRDAPGRGRKSSLPAAKVSQVITGATQPPPPGRTRWSVRSMAEASGLSKSTVHHLWQKNDLKPHRTRTFKLSNDPRFEEKFWDVIGLYLNPPENAIVLCCDEKSQCQALERSQPGLPLGIGHLRTRTHDYIRHGTITLFAALSYLEGKIISCTATRHTHVEWLRFLKQIDRETPTGLDIHIIADNYATHKKQEVRDWLEKHPRFTMHFTPTGSSWMNLVERFFADLTEDCIREGSFSSVGALAQAIECYLAERNLNPKPYRWQAKGADILAKIHKARAALDSQTLCKPIAGTGH